MATTQSGTSGTRSTGTGGMRGMGEQMPDTTYDLISVLYHTLQGCQTYEKYARDAEQAQQQDCAQFFHDAGREFERIAQQGQQLLAQCLQQGQGISGSRSGQLHSQMSGSSGQHGQSGMASGQQGGGRSSSNMGSSSSNPSGSGSSRGSSTR